MVTNFKLQIDRAEPTKLDTWQAHDTAIVGVQMAAHEAGMFLITASTDHTAKLWDMKGHCVGVFGQVKNCAEINYGLNTQLFKICERPLFHRS